MNKQQLQDWIERVQQADQQLTAASEEIILRNFEQLGAKVAAVHLDDHHVLTVVTNDRRQHEIRIYNTSHREDGQFTPELSWFSTTAKQTETTVLNYLRILGIIATQLEQYAGSGNSPLFDALKMHMVEKARRQHERLQIEQQLQQWNAAEKKAAAVRLFNKLQVGDYFCLMLPTKYLVNKEVLTLIKVIAIGPKTVTFEIVKLPKIGNFNDSTNCQVQRKPRADFFELVYGYDILSFDTAYAEVQRTSIVDSMQRIKKLSHISGITTLDAVVKQLQDTNIIEAVYDDDVKQFIQQQYNDIFVSSPH